MIHPPSVVELGVLVCIQFQPWALEVGCPGGTTLPERRGIFRCASCGGEAGTVLPLFSFFFVVLCLECCLECLFFLFRFLSSLFLFLSSTVVELSS